MWLTELGSHSQTKLEILEREREKTQSICGYIFKMKSIFFSFFDFWLNTTLKSIELSSSLCDLHLHKVFQRYVFYGIDSFCKVLWRSRDFKAIGVFALLRTMESNVLVGNRSSSFKKISIFVEIHFFYTSWDVLWMERICNLLYALRWAGVKRERKREKKMLGKIVSA